MKRSKFESLADNYPNKRDFYLQKADEVQGFDQCDIYNEYKVRLFFKKF